MQQETEVIFNKLYFCPIFPPKYITKKVIGIERLLVSRPEHLHNK